MSFLANLGATLLGDALGTGMQSAFDLNNYEKKAEIDYNYTKKLWDYQMQNKHQLEVGDLEASGLNKILSATNGQALSATNISGSSGNISSKVGQTALQLAIEEKKANIAKTEAETHQIEAQTNRDLADSTISLNSTQSKVNLANVDYLAKQGIFMDAQTAKTAAETQEVFQNIENSIRSTEAYVRQLDSGTALNYQQIENFKAEVKRIAKEAESIGLDIDLKQADLDSWTRKLQNKSAEYQYQFITEHAGEIMYKTGYGLKVLSPFTAGSVPLGDGVRVGSTVR